MPIDQDLMTLSRDELLLLVQQLRQQLSEREALLAALPGRLWNAPIPLDKEVAPSEQILSANNVPVPGSQDDLFASLEQTYPERR